MLDVLALDRQEGIPITDDPGFLATLYPALLKLARAELHKRGLPASEADDAVQSAFTAWFEVTVTEEAAYAFMRARIRNRIRDRARGPEEDLSLESLK